MPPRGRPRKQSSPFSLSALTLPSQLSTRDTLTLDETLAAANEALPPPPEMAVIPIADYVASRLKGETGKPHPEQAKLDELREQCRKGDPFPLTAYQWPELVITDPDEAKHFDGEIGSATNPCLRLDFWQRDILKSTFDDSIRELFIKGNTKAGKGASVAMAVNLWFDVWSECKIIVTSTSFDHAVRNAYGELIGWREKMKAPDRCRILTEGYADGSQHYLAVRNPISGEAFSGQHGPRTLFWFDEASDVRQLLYDNAQKQFRKIIATSNPRTLFGWFRVAYKPCVDQDKTQTISGPFGLRRCFTVDGADNLNVKAKRLESPLGPTGGISIPDPAFPGDDDKKRFFAANEPIPPEFYKQVALLIPNQCDYSRFIGLAAHADKREVNVYAHGKFPNEDPTKQIILASWLDFHEAAWRPYGDPLSPKVQAFGLDVAASLDGDESCLVPGGEFGVTDIHRMRERDTMLTVGWVIRTAQERYGIDLTRGAVPVTVDMDGLGKGVGDRLRELKVWVIEFRGNAGSQVDPKRYANLRAEAYGELGRRLEPEGPWGAMAWAIMPDEKLRPELVAPEKVYGGSDGLRFLISPKRRRSDMSDSVRTVQDIIGRSPDTADGVVYLFHAVRELGLWSSAILNFQQQPMAFPMTDSAMAKMRGDVERAAVRPASQQTDDSRRVQENMTPETRDLLAYLGKQAAGGREWDGWG